VDESIAGCFRLLCEDLGKLVEFQELFPAFGQASIDGSLSEIDLLKQRIQGKVIGIYTLTESSGHRAQQLLQNWFPDLDVRVSNDHGGSDHLKNIARQSDFLIVAAKSAKHAATDFIKAERPADKSPLIYPSGKGSSSIVDAVFSALRDDITA
jgi:5,10-methylene-tetrahydrofolate dehydrogenase/methenyl tetrahydrofolate cyclohydrolase